MNTPAKFDNPKDVLIAARKLIEKPENWCRDYYTNYDGAHCMVGAISAALCRSPDNHEVWLAKKLLMRANGMRSVTGFNDNPANTHADILAAFDRAIAGAP